MSEYNDEDYDDEGTEANGPKALRDALAKSRKSEKDALKRLADLETKQAEYDKVSRATTLKEALTAAGGTSAAKVAAFYPADSEVTADAVKSWLEEHKDVFNLTAKPADPEQAQESGEPEEAPNSPAVQAYLDAQARVNALESDRVATPGNEEALLAAMAELEKNAKSMEELHDGLGKLGAPVARGGYRS